ncbi:MAG TPA: hypothetical protein VGV87_26615, partial [Blastocatellia bacterium]|nr:hypothetical protein [Blastocatellia bacterium]
FQRANTGSFAGGQHAGSVRTQGPSWEASSLQRANTGSFAGASTLEACVPRAYPGLTQGLPRAYPGRES